MRKTLLTLTSVAALTTNNVQGSYQEFEEKPIIIKNFVGCRNEIKEILFNKMGIRIKTNKDVLLDLDKEKITDIPLGLSREKLLSFLTNHSWLQVVKVNEEDYALKANVRGLGGMYSETSIESLRDKIENKLGTQHSSLGKISSSNSVVVKKELKNLMFAYVGNADQDLADISILATKLYQKLENLPREQFQTKAQQYFSHIFPNSNISFADKMGGEQLGNRVIVQLEDGENITYHAKTHRGGLKSQHSSSSKPVDLKELLIYKILESTGIGVESHFFYDDINNFYIATKDAGYDDLNKRPGVFTTYEKIRKDHSSEALVENPLIVNGFIKADIMSRLLLLSDVINNGDNTGVSETGLFKIVDFNPPLTREYQNPKVFEDWLSGNNQYNYSDPVAIKILKKDKETKLKEASSVFKELKDFSFEPIVWNAYETILSKLGSLSIPGEQINDLEDYAKAICKNYNYLKTQF